MKAVSSMLAGLLVILIAIACIMAISFFAVGIFSSLYQEQQVTNLLHYKDAEYLSMAISGSTLEVTNGGQYTARITQIMVWNPNTNSPPTFINKSITLYPGSSYNFTLQTPYRYAILTSYGNEWYVPFDINNPVLDVYALTITSTAGGSTTPAPGTYYYTYGDKVTVTATPAQYYSWGGWSGTGAYSYTGMNNPITLYMWSNITEAATFNPIYATVTFLQEGMGSSASGTVLTVDGNSYTYSQLPISFTWQEGTTHSFSWISSVSGGSGAQYVWQSTTGLPSLQSSSFTVTGSGSITAAYQPQYYLSVYVNSGSGSVSGSGWYNAGSGATASESPAGGWHFIDWTNGNTGSSYSFTMNGPNSIGANFGINSYSVMFYSNPVSGAPISTNHGSGTTPYSVSVNYGSTISYTFGSSFSGGSGVRYVNPNPSSGSQTIYGSTTITASYTTQLYVNAYVNSGSGSVSGGGWYNEDTLVTVTASPSADWYFSSWTGVSGGNPYQFNIYSPTSIGANFEEEGELYYSALDYGTNANAYSTAYFTGPETTSITWSGDTDGGYVMPGTYSVSYGNSQYGAGVYSAPSSATVSPGGDTFVFATYYTPTALSASFTVGVNTYTIYGYLTTSDNGAGLGGQTLTVTFYSGGNIPLAHGYPVTASNGYYSYTVNDPIGDTGISYANAYFGGNGGYISVQSPNT
ncbi:MAG: hypothetical protein JRN37_08250 [Nitrososphaerota archaeon]|nr:hypothetical protein [Nitrososphaerota archaeon]MDG7039122.1 hypothetical protein [Nitrososphaerota archaeon]